MGYGRARAYDVDNALCWAAAGAHTPSCARVRVHARRASGMKIFDVVYVVCIGASLVLIVMAITQFPSPAKWFLGAFAAIAGLSFAGLLFRRHKRRVQDYPGP